MIQKGISFIRNTSFYHLSTRTYKKLRTVERISRNSTVPIIQVKD